MSDHEQSLHEVLVSNLISKRSNVSLEHLSWGVLDISGLVVLESQASVREVKEIRRKRWDKIPDLSHHDGLVSFGVDDGEASRYTSVSSSSKKHQVLRLSLRRKCPGVDWLRSNKSTMRIRYTQIRRILTKLKCIYGIYIPGSSKLSIRRKSRAPKTVIRLEGITFVGVSIVSVSLLGCVISEVSVLLRFIGIG